MLMRTWFRNEASDWAVREIAQKKKKKKMLRYKGYSINSPSPNTQGKGGPLKLWKHVQGLVPTIRA